MDAKEVRTKLVAHTQENCGYIERRHILDMGRLGECPRKLTWELLNDCPVSHDIKMRLYKGRQMETEIQVRLRNIFRHLYEGPKPIYALDGKVVGFTDGQAGNVMIKIRSVPDDDALPNGRAPNNHYWQTQALMHFGHFSSCIMIYESRTSGRIRTYGHSYSPAIGKSCERKATLVLASTAAKSLPACDCGKCEERGFNNKRN